MRARVKVALVDAGDLGRIREWSVPPDVFSNRVSSLTNTSRMFLEGERSCAWKEVLCINFVQILVHGRISTGRARAPCERCRCVVSTIPIRTHHWLIRL